MIIHSAILINSENSTFDVPQVWGRIEAFVFSLKQKATSFFPGNALERGLVPDLEKSQGVWTEGVSLPHPGLCPCRLSSQQKGRRADPTHLEAVP